MQEVLLGHDAPPLKCALQELPTLIYQTRLQAQPKDTLNKSTVGGAVGVVPSSQVNVD